VADGNVRHIAAMSRQYRGNMLNIADIADIADIAERSK